MIDEDRLQAEWDADADVLRSLRENGDVPTLVRPVDVHFIGSAENIGRMSEELDPNVWKEIRVSEYEGGPFALDAKREQTTEESAIRALTVAVLELELLFDVSFDGWGCLATQLNN
jgi:hypothetical protein